MTLYLVTSKHNPDNTKLVFDSTDLPTNTSEFNIKTITLEQKDVLLLGHILLDNLNPSNLKHLIQNRLDSDTPENYRVNLQALQESIQPYVNTSQN